MPHWHLPLLHFLHPKQINLSLFWSHYIWHLQILSLYIRPIFNILFYYFIQYDVSNTKYQLILSCKYDVYVPIEISLLWSTLFDQLLSYSFLLELTWLNIFLGAKVLQTFQLKIMFLAIQRPRLITAAVPSNCMNTHLVPCWHSRRKSTDKSEEIKKNGS